MDLCNLSKHGEPVSKFWWDEQLVAAGRRELHSKPPAKRRGSEPQINNNVKNFTHRASDNAKLGRCAILKVKTSHDVASRAGMIVLHKIDINTVPTPDGLVVAFKKETAAVFEKFRIY